jgi:hypothetical protein
MSLNFEDYSECVLAAYQAHQRTQDLVEKKSNLLKDIAQHHNHQLGNILFLGFSPWVLTQTQGFAIAEITDPVLEFLEQCGLSYQVIDLDSNKEKFDTIVAADEYFTFAANEQLQRDRVNALADICSGMLVTSLRDYKNVSQRDREFSIPACVRNSREFRLFLEFHDQDHANKNAWHTRVYEFNDTVCKLYGPFTRKAMFFKQLAKFCYDAGAREFVIHKNIMYKSLVRKNYEHVISAMFG